MNKLIFKKISYDYLVFFSISIISSSAIVWVFQAVNFLDIMVEDGRSYLVYINYSILNIPKIISKLFPFMLFFSFYYILNKYENNNELIIFWNFGINKIQLVYFFFKLSIILMTIQILLTSYIVPNTLQYSRDLMKNSNINLFEGFIKPKKFNDTIKGLTIYSEEKNTNNDLVNIYIKKDTGKDSFQITYARIGRLKIGVNDVLELYDGETINSVNNKISKFNFIKSDFSLKNLESNVFEYNKIQETPSIVLISCLNKLFNKNINYLNNISLLNYEHNCSQRGIQNVYRELYKRLIIPLYIPVLILIILFLTLKSKVEKDYSQLKLIIFLINFILIVLSESSIKLISEKMSNNYLLIFLPMMIGLILILNFNYHFKIKYKYQKLNK